MEVAVCSPAPHTPHMILEDSTWKGRDSGGKCQPVCTCSSQKLLEIKIREKVHTQNQFNLIREDLKYLKRASVMVVPELAEVT